MAANHAAVVAREEKLKAERVQRLAGKLGIDLTDPKQAFGFVLGCASSATYRLQKQVRPLPLRHGRTRMNSLDISLVSLHHSSYTFNFTRV